MVLFGLIGKGMVLAHTHGKCTDQTESSHVTMLDLVATAFKTMANMRREGDDLSKSVCICEVL
jgi:hypothetical protein